MGHGLIIRENSQAERWAACTCGWETAHAYAGDDRFVRAACERDWDIHCGVAALRHPWIKSVPHRA